MPMPSHSDQEVPRAADEAGDHIMGQSPESRPEV